MKATQVRDAILFAYAVTGLEPIDGVRFGVLDMGKSITYDSGESNNHCGCATGALLLCNGVNPKSPEFRKAEAWIDTRHGAVPPLHVHCLESAWDRSYGGIGGPDLPPCGLAQCNYWLGSTLAASAMLSIVIERERTA